MEKTSKKRCVFIESEGRKRQNDPPETACDLMLVSTEECETDWYFDESISTEDDLRPCPSHELFRQPKNSDWCCFASLVNIFDSLDEGRRLLGSKRKADALAEDDFTYVRDRLEKDMRQNVTRNGVSSSDVWQYFKEFSKDLDITKWRWNRKNKQDLLKMLLPNKAKSGLAYVLFGKATSDKTIKDKVKNVLLCRRKTPNKNSFSSAIDKNEQMTHKMQNLARERLREWKSRFGTFSTNEDAYQPHAICIKFNEEGVPYKYDPGNPFLKFHQLI
jgi:hypothetical protein